jgi:hypothetical protein
MSAGKETGKYQTPEKCKKEQKRVLMEKIINRDMFDFEIGYLTKSPCIACENKSELPKCHAECRILDRIQTTLARGISSQRSSYES